MNKLNKLLQPTLWFKGVKIKFVPRLLVLLILTAGMWACSSNDSVKIREGVWQQKVKEFEPVGKTKAELFEWQKNNDVPLNSFPNRGGTILETIEGDGLVCSRWHVLLSTEVDSNGVITSYTVTSAGTCL